MMAKTRRLKGIPKKAENLYLREPLRAEVEEASPIPVQMWTGGEPNPSADVDRG
jgi:hypothetical protein